MSHGDIGEDSFGQGPQSNADDFLVQDYQNTSPDDFAKILADMNQCAQQSTTTQPNELELFDSRQASSKQSGEGVEAWDLQESSHSRAYFDDNIAAIQPNWKEISQGAIGDCFFVAALQAVAKQQYGPDHLRSMIKRVDGPSINDQSAEDVFEVTFPGQQPVQVSYRELHPYGASQSDGTSNVRGGLAGRWPSILEAAAGKIAALREPNKTQDHQYPAQHLEKIADIKWALDLLTGQNRTDSQFLRYGITGEQARDWTQTMDQGGVNSLIAGSKLLWTMAFNGRSSGEVDALLNDAAGKNSMVVLGKDNHAYTLMDYQHGPTAAQSTVFLRNPWGFRNAETLHTDRAFQDGKRDGLLQLSVTELHRSFDIAFIASGNLVEFPSGE